MGLYKYIRDLWKKPKDIELWKQRLVEWRREPSTVRVLRPTRIDRARSLGYRAKPGFIVVRQRVMRGGRKRETFKSGRRSKHRGMRKVITKNYRQVAEERTQKKFRNCEVLNSYWVAQDGKYYWFEVILLDRAHPAILADKQINWITQKKGRVFRGLTRAGKKSQRS
ncbi:MAG: 50S ribosomal protein L15e [archaeon]